MFRPSSTFFSRLVTMLSFVTWASCFWWLFRNECTTRYFGAPGPDLVSKVAICVFFFLVVFLPPCTTYPYPPWVFFFFFLLTVFVVGRCASENIGHLDISYYIWGQRPHPERFIPIKKFVLCTGTKYRTSFFLRLFVVVWLFWKMPLCARFSDLGLFPSLSRLGAVASCSFLVSLSVAIVVPSLFDLFPGQFVCRGCVLLFSVCKFGSWWFSLLVLWVDVSLEFSLVSSVPAFSFAGRVTLFCILTWTASISSKMFCIDTVLCCLGSWILSIATTTFFRRSFIRPCNWAWSIFISQAEASYSLRASLMGRFFFMWFSLPPWCPGGTVNRGISLHDCRDN